MKTSLYSTTALAAAGLLTLGASDAFAQAAAPAAPEKLKLELGGFFNQLIGFQTAETAATRTFDQKSDSEVYFQGTVKLDSGINVGMLVQLETDAHASSTSSAFSGTSTAQSNVNNNYIDESYMRIYGDFGEFRLGNMDGLSQGISIAAPNVGLVNIANSDLDAWIKKPSGQATISSTCCSSTLGGGDLNRVGYVSPSIAGFRAGGSYAPSSANSNAQPGDGINDNETYQLDAAIQYTSPKIMDTTFRGYVGWWRNGGAKRPNTATTTADAAAFTAQSENWSFGADATWGDITIGAGYQNSDNGPETSVQNASKTNDQRSYNAGIAYKPAAFALSYTWQYRESEVTSANPDNDSTTRHVIGATYPVGPGVTLGAQAVYQKWVSESNAAASEDKAWALIGGIGVSF